MTDYRRRKFPGGFYFFTVVTYQRRSILNEETARKCLRQAWMDVESQKPFTTVALCLMPDHLHCVWKLPPLDKDYSIRWAAIKSRFTRLWLANGMVEADQSQSRHKKRERGVWQRRFWEHQLRDWDDLAAHVKYIHFNPVKHGFVEHPRDWQWSTYHKYHKQGYHSNDTWDIIQKETEALITGE